MFWWFHNKCTIFLIQVPFVPSDHITWKGMNFRCGKLPHYIEYYRFIWGLTYSPTWYDQANCIQSVSSRDNNPGRQDPISSISKFCWVEKRNLLYLMWSDLFFDMVIDLTFLIDASHSSDDHCCTGVACWSHSRRVQHVWGVCQGADALQTNG